MKKPKGVITVTLALTLLVMLAIITTALESARTAAGRFLIENAMRLSTEAVLADYDALLFGEYHIFGRNPVSAAGRTGREFVSECLNLMLDKNTVRAGTFLWKFNPQDITVTDCVCLTDYDGAFFRKQAVEYMEFRSVGQVTEMLLEALGMFDKTNEALEILNYENEARSALAGIDTAILDLMESVDGLKTDSDGIKQNIFGKIKTANRFVKKLLIGEPTMLSAKINHNVLFDALQKEYEDPEEQVDKLVEKLSETVAVENEISGIKAEEAALSVIMQNGTLAEQTEAAARKVVLEAKRLALEAEKLIKETEVALARNKLEKLLEGCKTACESALSTMDIIRQRRAEGTPKILTYAEQLAQMAGKLDSGLYLSLMQGLNEMKKYIGQDVEGFERIPDFDGMENTLILDSEILSESLEMLNGMKSAGNRAKLETVERIGSELRLYSFDKLQFDYSGIQLKPNGLNPIQTVKNIISDGISAMVLPSGTNVSERKISGEDLPGCDIGLTAEDEAGLNPDIGADTILSVFKNSPLSAAKELLKDGADAIAEKALFLSYLTDHFTSFVKPEKEGDAASDTDSSASDTTGAEHALKYELEYILCGQETDRENLNAFINRLLLVRTAFCLIHVLSDSEKCATAKAFATGLLGFTGMPILIELMKYVVLFVWAFDEALVETSAVLRGKKVAVIPDKTTFSTGFSELLLMTPAVIEAKAESRPENGAFGLDYSSYLLLFLLLENETTQNLRTMDLIQENLRRFDDRFRMASHIFGFNADADFSLSALFTGLPFSMMKEACGFEINVKGCASY